MVACAAALVCLSEAAVVAQQWVGVGPPGASVSAAAVDPTDSSVVYLGTPGHGLYRSEDGGSTYSNVTAGLPGPEVTAVAVHPVSGNVWVGSSMPGFAAGHLMRSDDGGSTWVEANVAAIDRIEVIAFAPSDPAIMYVGTFLAGLYRSVDGGSTFGHRALAGDPDPVIMSLAIHPTDPDRLYLGLGFFFGHSEDGGATVAGALDGPRDAADLAFDPASFDVVYACNADGVWRSADAADSWQPAWSGMDGLRCVALTRGPSGALYAATVAEGVFVSSDAGGSWVPAGAGLLDSSIAVLASSSTSVLAGGSTGGLFATTGPSAPWSDLTGGLTMSNVGALAVAPDGAMWAGTEGGAVYSMGAHDGGFSLIGVPGADNAPIRTLVVHPSDGSTVYAGTARGIYRTGDAGADWSLVTDGDLDVRVIAIDPNAPASLLASSWDDGVFASADDGQSWTPAGAGLPAGRVSDLLVDRDDSNVVFAAIAGEGAYRSEDGGATFAPANTGIETAFGISLHQHANGRVWVTTGGGIYASDDRGQSWSLLAGSLALTIADAVIADRADPDIVVAGQRHGAVVRSTDGGQMFTDLGGLDAMGTRRLVAGTAGLAAATAGDGVFILTAEPVGDADAGPTPGDAGSGPDATGSSVEPGGGAGCCNQGGGAASAWWLMALLIVYVSRRRGNWRRDSR